MTVTPPYSGVGDSGVDDGLRRLVDVLLPGIDRFADLLTDRITEEEDAYRNHGHVKHDQLRTSCADNLHSMVTQLGRDDLDLRVPHDTGRFKAEHGVPLSAVTHAYRVAGRFLWECVLTEAGENVTREMPHVATAIWSVSDTFTDAVAVAYRETMSQRAHRDRQVKSLLLAALLGGRLDEGTHLWECADALRLPQSGVFAVVSAETAPQDSPADEDALHDVEGALRALGVWSVWRQEDDAQVGLLSLRSPGSLAQAVELLRGRSIGRVGVSTLFHGLEQAPGAFRQARLACACVEPGAREVASYGDSPVRLMVVSAPDSAQHAVRKVLGPVLELPQHERELLLETLTWWFASGGSATETAARMYCHRNTVTYRLRRVQELTGHSPTDPVGASEIHLALEAHRLLTGPLPAGSAGS
ncbi:PucR family transcriptional regulator [Streptomyces sp. NPDC058964]|uniref:PucR family transcriptional regulator n=1 Tax=Streptomyces sp. NPDC058964 TaxID=3346681 RepID=UPI00369C1369